MHAVLQGKGLFWFKTERRNNELRSWKHFKKAFRRQYIKIQDDEDLRDELRGRTQGQDKEIADYISFCKFIASHLNKPLKEKKLVKIIRENLRPEYYLALQNEKIESLSRLLRLGNKFERNQCITKRYSAPVPREKMRLPAAGYVNKSSRQRSDTYHNQVAALNESETQSAQVVNKKLDKKSKNKPAETQVAAAQTAPPPQCNTANLPPTPNATFPKYTGTKPKTNQYQDSSSTHSSTPQGHCIFCSLDGHQAKTCPQRQGRFFCYNCERPDVTTNTCPTPHCIVKRSEQVNSLTRRSPNPTSPRL